MSKLIPPYGPYSYLDAEERSSKPWPYSTSTQEYALLDYQKNVGEVSRKSHYDDVAKYSSRSLHEHRPHGQGDSSSQSIRQTKRSVTTVKDIKQIGMKGVSIWQWKYQILGAITATGSFAALIATAAKFDGKPSSDWALAWLSINAVVAALTTLIRLALLATVTSCMMEQRWTWFSQAQSPVHGRPLKDFEAIDSASRGPWGSLSWLLRYPLSISVVNFAALWTLFAIAFDVFSQQAVRVENRMLANTTLKAHLPWARNVTHAVDQAWVAAMYDGIFNPDIDDVQAICPTSNCTWDPVPSIGVCGDCWRMNFTWEDMATMRTCTNDSQPICNYTGFSGTILEGVRPPNTTINIGDEYQIHDAISIHAMPGQANTYMNKYIPDLSKTNWFPLTIEVLQLSYTLNEGNITFGTPNLTECAFWYCMQSFSVNVTSGNQRQAFRTGSKAYTSVDNSFLFIDGSPPGNSAVNFYNSSMMFNDTEYFDTQGHTFSVSNTSFAGWIYNTVTENGQVGFSSKEFIRLPKPLTQAWEDTAANRTAWVSRVAKSLSNLVRQQNAVPADEDSYSGTVYSVATYIRILWLWMLYPAGMLVAAFFVLAATIITWRKSQRDVVGNGSLELIFSNLESGTKPHAAQNCTYSQKLFKDLRENKVRLERSDSKWTFKDI